MHHVALVRRFVSREEWPEERFPPWAHGAGYVLSADLAAELAPGGVRRSAAARPLCARTASWTVAPSKRTHGGNPRRALFHPCVGMRSHYPMLSDV